MGEPRIPTIRHSSLHEDEALYDGIKPWMANSVRNWVVKRIKTYISNRFWYNDQLIHQLELKGRINFGNYQDGAYLHSAVIQVFDSNEDYALDIVQGLIEIPKVIEDGYDYGLLINKGHIEELSQILKDGGSKWHIVIEGDKAKLESRVNTTTTAAYQKLKESAGDFASHLQTAWEYAYGRNPNPSEAYTYSVKAVEAAAWRLITPKNTTSTLGTLIKDFLAQAQAGKFSTVFKDKKENTSIDAITKVMARLWEGHSDRHATGEYIKPTQQEAEAAVHMAILLCHLFSTNAIVPSSS